MALSQDNEVRWQTFEINGRNVTIRLLLVRFMRRPLERAIHLWRRGVALTLHEDAQAELMQILNESEVVQTQLQTRVEEQTEAVRKARAEVDAKNGELTAKHEEMHMTREEIKVVQAGLQARVQQEQQALQVARAEAVAVAKARVEKEQQMQRAADALRDEHNQIVRTQREAYLQVVHFDSSLHLTKERAMMMAEKALMHTCTSGFAQRSKRRRGEERRRGWEEEGKRETS